jgi:hypothetical protein
MAYIFLRELKAAHVVNMLDPEMTDVEQEAVWIVAK